MLDASDVSLFVKVHINYSYDQYFTFSVNIKYSFEILHIPAAMLCRNNIQAYFVFRNITCVLTF